MGLVEKRRFDTTPREWWKKSYRTDIEIFAYVSETDWSRLLGSESSLSNEPRLINFIVQVLATLR